jgi:hypothetical protein
MAELDDQLVRIQQAHHRSFLSLQGTAADLIGAAWDLYQPLSGPAASLFIAAAEQIIAGVVLETAASAVGFMLSTDQLLEHATPDLPMVPTIRGGASARDVYMRSVYQARRQIAAGKTFDEAMASGRARAQQTAATDVSLANRQTIADAGPLRPWVVGYRRVLTGVSCALCAAASTQRYRRADLAPIHPACDCDVAELIGTHDPGRVINQRLLDDLRSAGKGGAGNYYDRDAPYIVDADGRVVTRRLERDADGRERVVAGDEVLAGVHEHGELGRTLVNRRHEVTDFDAEPRPAAAKAKPSRYSESDAAIVREAQRRGMKPADVIAEREARDAVKAARRAEERAAAKALGVDSPEVIAVADKYGVSPSEVLTARTRLEDVKAQIREEAARVQADAFGTLERYGTWKVKRPGSSAGGEYDWLEQLDARERARLSRVWYSDAASDAPDLIAQAIGFADPRYSGDVDEALEHWLDLTRRYEAAGALRRGKIPSAAAYSDQLDVNALLAGARGDGYDVVKVLGDPLDAAGHVAAVERDLVRLDAEQYLGEALDSTRPPWQMTYQSWYEDVADLEYRFREGTASADDEARYAELVPRFLDEPDLGFEDLYARIVHTAAKAGQEVSPNARIPW